MKDDEIALRIEAFDAANGGGVGWYEDKGVYHCSADSTGPLGVEARGARVSVAEAGERSR